MKSEFAELLKQRREAVGLSQGDLAEKLGYSTPQFISNWERDLSHPPPKVFKKLAKIMRIDPKQMVIMYKRSCMAEFERRLDDKLGN